MYILRQNPFINVFDHILQYLYNHSKGMEAHDESEDNVQDPVL